MKTWLNVAEAAEYSEVSRDTIYTACERREIHHARVGGRLLRELREDNQRRRRIAEEEEARLLAVAPPLLRSMIIAALDTGMRQGEMLSLRFKDIDIGRGLITLRGETTKSRRTRLVPSATARLRAVLGWLQLDADGEKKLTDALVFSDGTGWPVGTFRTSWVTAVLTAHDVAPVWMSYNWTALTAECHAEFRRTNLRWHDLRSGLRGERRRVRSPKGCTRRKEWAQHKHQTGTFP